MQTHYYVEEGVQRRGTSDLNGDGKDYFVP
jgi:hypothetical protein